MYTYMHYFMFVQNISHIIMVVAPQFYLAYHIDLFSYINIYNYSRYNSSCTITLI